MAAPVVPICHRVGTLSQEGMRCPPHHQGPALANHLLLLCPDRLPERVAGRAGSRTSPIECGVGWGAPRVPVSSLGSPLWVTLPEDR